MVKRGKTRSGNGNENLIPKLSKEEIQRRASHVKPVTTIPGVGICYIKPNSGNNSHEWCFWYERLRKAKELVFLTEIVTCHPANKTGRLRTTVAQILSQIPDDFLKDTRAFELVGEKTGGSGAEEADFHHAIVHLYTVVD